MEPVGVAVLGERRFFAGGGIIRLPASTEKQIPMRRREELADEEGREIVQRPPDQRATLEQRTRSGTAIVAVQRPARIVCKADGGPDGPAWADASCGSSIGRLAHMAARGRLGT